MTDASLPMGSMIFALQIPTQTFPYTPLFTGKCAHVLFPMRCVQFKIICRIRRDVIAAIGSYPNPGHTQKLTKL
jgi:hypothetical protein